MFFWAFAQMNSLNSQVVITEELFDEMNGATTGVMSDGSPWTASPPGECDGNAGLFEVNNSAFTIQDVEGFNCCSCGGGTGGGNCGDNQNVLLFEDIDISAACGNVRIQSTWTSSGSMECEPGGPFTTCEGGHDQLVGQYSVDNGPYVTFGYFCGNTLVQNPNTGFNITGTTLDIRFTGGNQAATEIYSIESVVVDYDDSNCCPTGTLSGMGDLCPGECVDLNWNVSGGEAPYTLTFEVSAGGFSLSQGLPGAPVMGALTVCYDDSGGIPSFDVASNTLNLTDFFGTSYQVELINITDNAGCTESITGQAINVTLQDPPNINTIPTIEICDEIPGPAQLDLSLNDADIGSGLSVQYYSDAGLTIPIGPIINVSSDMTVFATVTNGSGCVSSSINFDIELMPLPVITNPGPIQSCGEYTLPPITGTNITTGIGYWTGSGQTGSQLAEGTTITTDLALFIYDSGNGCPSEIGFSIDILPQPEITEVPAVTACGSYTLPPIQGVGLSGSESYRTLPNGGGGQFFPGDVITMNTILYLFDEIGMCSDEVVLIVNITDGPEIAMSDSLVACNTVFLPPVGGIDLSNNASYFSGQNGTGTEFPPGSNVDDNMILYAFDEAGDCSAEQAVEIVVIVGPTINTPLDVTECEYYVLPTPGGENLMNPSYIFNGESLFEGDTIFESGLCSYTDSISENIFVYNGFPITCPISVDFNITILENPNAGEDVSLNDCGGSSIELNSIISNTAEQGGDFIDPLNTGVISGNTLDASQIMGNTFDFLYTVENMCGIDTANYTLSITDQANAGNNTSTSVCADEFLELINFVSEADPGGVFVNSIDMSVEAIINSNSIVDAGGSLLFYYIVGQGGGCDPDTADVNFVIVDTPVLDLEEGVTSCSAIELPAINGTGLSGNESYNTEPDGSGITYEVGDSLDASDLLYVQSGVGMCAALDSVEYIITIPTPTLITETLCNDDTLFVNNQAFYFGNETGTQMFITDAGCDSLVEIELSFFVPDTNFISEEVCWGGEFTIFGVTLDADQPSVQVNIPLIGANGCDSIIFVDLIFDDPLTRNIDESLCSNDSILINGIFYSENNPTGIDTVNVPGTCDTILFINVTFEESVSLLIDDTLCPGESIMVGGETFDEDTPEGVVEISGPSGCDSTVTVDLSFFDEATGMLTGSFCANDLIDTLGEIFSIDNPSMDIVLEGASAQNCDSTVFVNFTFDLIDEGMIDTVVCEAIDVVIGGETFNENNSSGQVILQSVNGCDSIVNVTYTLAPVEFEISVSDASCGSENGFIVIEGANIVSDSYDYIVDFDVTGQVSLGDTIFNISPGAHMIELSAMGSTDCSEITDFTINEVDDVDLSIISVVTIAEGSSYMLNIPNIDNFDIVWTPPTSISCTDCANPEFNPTETTEYIVTISNGPNCTATDTILIRVENDYDIYIPNTFTPNDDGLNDRFVVFSETDISYDLSIYDRWGNRVYEVFDLTTNDTSTGWDGSFNNVNVTQGVYAYKALLYIEEDEEAVIRTGTITVLR